MLEYRKNEPLISIHLPKCGGSSLKAALKRWYGKDLYFHYYDEQKNKMPEVVKAYKGKYFGLVKQGICIHGHYNKYRGFGIRDYYPDARQFMTFLRDPLEIYISNYYFVNRKVLYRDGSRYSIDMDINEYLSNVVKDGRSWYLTHFPDDVDEDDIAAYIESRFIFMGIMEEYQKSLDILADIIGKPSIKIPVYNKTERDDYHLDDSIVEAFKSKYSIDYKIYDYARRYIDSF